jgi:DNA end-binding protein Ku
VAQKKRAPRSLWTGSISFGLVNVPVRVFGAVHEHKLRFHLVHAKDDSPIGYEKICKREDKPVPNGEIVKAFEYKKGELVQLTDEDFEAVEVDGQHAIDLEDFVPYDQIDATFFAHTYLVGPEEGADTYTNALKAIVRRKHNGQEVHPVRESDEEDKAPDLMEALRLSLEQNGKRRPKRKRAKAVASAK